MTTQISGACAGSTIIDVLHSRATGQCTHRVEGKKRETLPFGFCVRKKKESLECFSLEDWRIARYTEREKERERFAIRAVRSIWTHGGETERPSRYIDYRNFERASYVTLRAIAPTRHHSPRLVPSLSLLDN